MTNLLKLPLAELCAHDEVLTSLYLAMKESQSLVAMVWTAWAFGLAVAHRFLEQELAARASFPTKLPQCPKCGCRLRSKGMLPRQIKTLVGLVHFDRRVGRCRNGCKEVMVAPLDQELGLAPYQQTSQEVVKLGCLLAVFVPLEEKRTASRIPAGSPELEQMPLIIGADGVMLPMRPMKKTPKGKTIWREVKVAILTRLGYRLSGLSGVFCTFADTVDERYKI